MTATTQPGIALDECIANLRGKMTHGDKPLEAAINYLIRLQEIEGKLREVIKPMKVAIIHAETTDDDVNMQKYRDLLDDLSALLLRGSREQTPFGLSVGLF